MSSGEGATGMLVDLGAPPGAVAAIPVVLTQNPEPPPGQGEEYGKSSPVALVVILLLAVATAVLVRSMTKRIKRLPSSFERPPGADRPSDDRDAEGPRA